VAEEASGTPSSCAQCMAIKGRDSPQGLLGTGTASGPAAQRPSSKGCRVEGRQVGMCMGTPVTPMSQCHRPAAQQSQCPRAPSRVLLPVCPALPPGQSWPGGSPKTYERNCLRRWWNYLERTEGGRLRLDKAAGGSSLQFQLLVGLHSKLI